MTTSTTRPLPARAALRSADRRIAAAWARLLVAAIVLLVTAAIVLTGTQSAHRAGAAAARTALASVSAALRAEHTVTGAWPADLVTVGTSVIDSAGDRIATVPAGVAIDYERSLDASRVVVTASAVGARATFDSARAAR